MNYHVTADAMAPEGIGRHRLRVVVTSAADRFEFVFSHASRPALRALIARHVAHVVKPGDEPVFLGDPTECACLRTWFTPAVAQPRTPYLDL